MKRKSSNTPGTGSSATPSDLDGTGYSDKSYRPGYGLEKSLPERSEDDLKRGFKEGG